MNHMALHAATSDLDLIPPHAPVEMAVTRCRRTTVRLALTRSRGTTINPSASMSDSLRSLRSPFVTLCERHQAFRPLKNFTFWMRRSPTGAIRKELAVRLKNGLPVPARCVEGLVLFARDERTPASSTMRYTLSEYAAQHGVGNIQSAPITELIDLISVAGDPADLDPLTDGIRFVGTLCERGLRLEDTLRPCADADEVRRAVEWIVVDHGRQHSRAKLGYEDAKALGEQRVGLRLREYQSRAVAWWHYEPWSVMLAINRGEPIGVGIGLPVSEDLYTRARHGELNTWDITPGELRSPSTCLVTEAVSMVPRREPSHTAIPSESVARSLIAQYAYLTSVESAGEARAVRVLGVAFSRINLRRLKSFGFAPVGAVLPDTDMAILERVMHIAGEEGAADACVWGNWRTLQLNLGGWRPLRPHEAGADHMRP